MHSGFRHRRILSVGSLISIMKSQVGHATKSFKPEEAACNAAERREYRTYSFAGSALCSATSEKWPLHPDVCMHGTTAQEKSAAPVEDESSAELDEDAFCVKFNVKSF